MLECAENYFELPKIIENVILMTIIDMRMIIKANLNQRRVKGIFMLKRKTILKILLGYFLFAIAFRFIGGEQFDYKFVTSEMGDPIGAITEIDKDTVVKQTFLVKEESLESLDIKFATFNRENKGVLALNLSDETNTELATGFIDVSTLDENTTFKWVLDSPITDAKNKSYTLMLTSDSMQGEAPAVYLMDTTEEGQTLLVNDILQENQLCFTHVGKTYFLFGQYYWYGVIGIAILFLLYYLWSEYRERKGKKTVLTIGCGVWQRYGFLIRQLISRDFKTKYKRSVLGYLWSFLSPLLTMLVQYLVFSKIFKQNIENFPVYLLSGIIIFNFFTDAVGQGLTAIVDNSTLITKVYVPKYIYPLTKVVSCSINLVISTIPLLIVALLTGTTITKAVFLIPFTLLCILIFCTGMSMLLCTTMVFFRDTQYLWGIISMVWMYATPIFYPENIIPNELRFIQTLNPVYHCIRFLRIVLIDGVSPEPKAYFFCAFLAAAVLGLGAFIFKKFQDKFVLYI